MRRADSNACCTFPTLSDRAVNAPSKATDWKLVTNVKTQNVAINPVCLHNGAVGNLASRNKFQILKFENFFLSIKNLKNTGSPS